MKGLLIIGAGGHGTVVADSALAMGWSKVAFLDDKAATLGRPLGLPIVGDFAELPTQGANYPYAVVAIGDANTRLALHERCIHLGLKVVTIVHPRAYVSTFAQLGSGCVVFAQAAVNANARLGAACIINTGATVDHDCVIDDGTHICPGAHLAGNVNIGARSWIGIGTIVRQGVNIGSDVTVGAGAVVVADVADRLTVVGIPAKPRRGS